MKNLAIIMSGGTGKRMNSDIPKQLLKIGRKNLLEITIEAFQKHPDIDTIFIVSHLDLIKFTEKLIADKKFSKVSKIIEGGRTRQISSGKGVLASDSIHDKILIHDSARPFVSDKIISRVLLALDKFDAVTPVIDSSDTLVNINKNGKIQKYLRRDEIKRVQTPQGFKRNIIVEAHKEGSKNSAEIFTDDSSMVIHYGLSDVGLVKGDPMNIKITYKSDIDNLR